MQEYYLMPKALNGKYLLFGIIENSYFLYIICSSSCSQTQLYLLYLYFIIILGILVSRGSNIKRNHRISISVLIGISRG